MNSKERREKTVSKLVKKINDREIRKLEVKVKLTPRPKTEVVEPFFARKLEVIDPPGGYHLVDLQSHAGMLVSEDAVPRYALPVGDQERKDLPIVAGCLDYFPAALAEVAHLSKVGNDKHNPGEPLHHARGKSMDHADCIVRHLLDRGTVDTDGVRHSAKVAWRALALLQEELEAAGLAPLARGAKLPEETGVRARTPLSGKKSD